MIRQITKRWHIKLKKSFMIGDKISTDKICASKSKLYFESYYCKKIFFNQIKRITKKLVIIYYFLLSV